MDKEKIKRALATFLKRDEERVQEITNTTLMGQEIGPDVFLMVTEERLRDLTAVVGVIAKELICEAVPTEGEPDGQERRSTSD